MDICDVMIYERSSEVVGCGIFKGVSAMKEHLLGGRG